jgi:hypothetical protein
MTSLTAGHAFWWLLTAACLLWYSTITLYVAVKGVRDIRGMVRRLKNDETEEPPPR